MSSEVSDVPLVAASMVPQISGTALAEGLAASVRLHVRTSGRSVQQATVADGSTSLLTESLLQYVRSWTFSTIRAAEFDTTLSVRYVADCLRVGISSATLDLPSSATFVFYRPCLDASVGSATLPRNIEGKVTCACDQAGPDAWADVDLLSGTGIVARTTVGYGGHWSLAHLPPGSFVLRVTAAGYEPRQMRVTISRDDRHTRSLDVSLNTRPGTIRYAEMPRYPDELESRGVQGDVHVSLGRPRPDVADGPDALRPLAFANASTWSQTLASAAPEALTYEYRLDDRDCSNPNPHIEAVFPTRITVLGSRRGSCDADALRQNNLAMLPLVTGPAVATYPQIANTAKIQGDVVLHVHTDGEFVRSIEVSKSFLLLDYAAEDLVRSWHFASRGPRSFDSTFAFRLRGGSCSPPRAPVEVDVEAPSRAIVSAATACLATNSSQVGDAKPVGPTIQGVVRCDCEERLVVPGAEVRLADQKTGRSISTRTNASGGYAFEGVQKGDYELSITAPGYLSLWARAIKVRKGRPPGLTRDDRLAPDSLRVASVDLPVYPVLAIGTNLQGQVHVRVDSSGLRSVIDGNPILAASAVANVSSWHITSGSGSPVVTYTYSLIDGDCQNPNPHVTMKLPFEVTIVGKRQAGCTLKQAPFSFPWLSAPTAEHGAHE